MDEASALNVVAVRAIETADGGRAQWSDDDRAWASRAAAEVVGAEATPQAFLARRAALVVEKLGTRQPAFARAVRALRWRPWVGLTIAFAAFALGIFVDQIDRSQRINILAPPVLGLAVWNLAVYLVMLAGYVIRYGDKAEPGPFRRAVAQLAGRWSRPRRSGVLSGTIVNFGEDWSRLAAGLYAMRAARILHCAAAALAAGVIVGLYMRGIAFEYRASWQSTFLDASTVRSIVAIAYAAGAMVTGIEVPSVDAVAAIRAPQSQNAATWIHLMAATMLVLVIVPRALLALACGIVERHRAMRMALPLDEPYFQRLLRSYRGGASRVRVIPYSYTPDPQAVTGIEAVVARAFGGGANLTLTAPVAYGADEAFVGDGASLAGTTLIVLFSATATPEHETHGAFLSALSRQRAAAEALFALVDESAFVQRWRGSPDRIADRRAAWRQVIGDADVHAIFIDLIAPDLAATETAVDAALVASER